MCWELVQDGENVKCWLNLDKIEKRGKGQFDWKNSVGKKFGVRYQWKNDDIGEKWFLIVGNLKGMIIIADNNNNYEIAIASIKKGKFGKMFDKITNEFKHNIGDIINDLKIINKEYRKDKKGQKFKYYKYQCLKCDNIDWIEESNLKQSKRCNLCSNKKVMKGVNDIATTHPHLCKYFVNQEDIYKYTANSSKEILMKCPKCDSQKKMIIHNLTKRGFSCCKCSDGISYPEKYTANILTQLNVKFITQLNHTTFNWCENFKYDFYLSDYNMIIETHGEQHYWYLSDEKKYKKIGKNGRNGIEEHENDILKCELAKLNGFEMNKNYFVIDSRKSTLEWMKKNIIETLGHIFDLSNIDWEKADLECQKSHMILACQLKKENQNLTTTQIAKIIEKKTSINHTTTTISRWLKNGTEIGLCYYDSKKEQKKKKGGYYIKTKQVDLNGNVIKIWNYAKEISEELDYNYGTLMCHINGRDKGKPYKGYIWEYVE